MSHSYTPSRRHLLSGLTAASLLALLTPGVRADLYAPATANSVLYVANTSAGEIDKVSLNGTKLGVFASGLTSPSGLAFDRAGNLYVAGGGTIEKFTLDGTRSRFANFSGFGLAFDSAGNLYASNFGNTIEEFSPTGQDLGAFATITSGNSVGLAFGGSGNLYSSNNGNFTVDRITPTGSISTFSNSGVNIPRDLAFDAAGNLYVANIGNATIDRITPSGVGSTFATTPGFATFGLAFDSAGNLYATGNGNGNILKFSPTGTPLGILATEPGTALHGLAFSPDLSIIPVPEPANMALSVFGLGAVALGCVRKFRRKQNAGDVAEHTSIS